MNSADQSLSGPADPHQLSQANETLLVFEGSAGVEMSRVRANLGQNVSFSPFMLPQFCEARLEGNFPILSFSSNLIHSCVLWPHPSTYPETKKR